MSAVMNHELELDFAGPFNHFEGLLAVTQRARAFFLRGLTAIGVPLE